jgi:putative addiction module killer protein
MLEREIEVYQTEDGKKPFLKWLDSLKDVRARAKIRVGIDRISLGNLGNCKAIGSGVSELKIDFGPGYRVYFGQIANRLVILLCGGVKSTQAKDIQKAKSYWEDYRKRHG